MNDAAQRYIRLEEQILEGRALGTLDEETEDTLLEEMDDLWLEMTEEDREWANQRAQKMLAVEAPEKLPWVDLDLRRGTTERPRQAA